MITSFSGYGVGVWMSWNRLVSRIFAAQKLRQHRLEFGYSGRGYVPDFVQIDTDVVVDQDVAHAAYRLPVRASAETRLAASPITSTFRITASCNCSDAMNVSLPGPMKRVMRWQRSSMW